MCDSFSSCGCGTVLYSVVYLFGAFAGLIICGLIALVALPVGLTLFVIAAVVVWLVLAICFWFLKIPIQLSEWKISLDNKAARRAARSSTTSRGCSAGGHAPLDSLTCRSPPGEPARRGHAITSSCSRGIFTGYVACFGYGQDLYVGWTFWVTLSPFRYSCMIVTRIWHSLVNRGSDLYTSLRYDSARAMRETMHSAAREGVDVAIGQLAGQGHGIIGCHPVVERRGHRGTADNATRYGTLHHPQRARRPALYVPATGHRSPNAYFAITIDAAVNLLEAREYQGLPRAERLAGRRPSSGGS